MSADSESESEQPPATPFEVRSEKEHRRASIGFMIGMALLILSAMGSCIAAPFLVPIFQLFLLIPIFLGLFFGWLGGWFRNWWVSLGLVSVTAAMIVAADSADPYGYAALASVLMTGSLPVGATFYDSWGLLYKVTVIPVAYGTACAVHGVMILRRERKKRDAETRGLCANCGYSLRGLLDARCLECGEPFDAFAVRLATSGEVDPTSYEPRSRARQP